MGYVGLNFCGLPINKKQRVVLNGISSVMGVHFNFNGVSPILHPTWSCILDT